MRQQVGRCVPTADSQKNLDCMMAEAAARLKVKSDKERAETAAQAQANDPIAQDDAQKAKAAESRIHAAEKQEKEVKEGKTPRGPRATKTFGGKDDPVLPETPPAGGKGLLLLAVAAGAYFYFKGK